MPQVSDRTTPRGNNWTASSEATKCDCFKFRSPNYLHDVKNGLRNLIHGKFVLHMHDSFSTSI